MVLNPSPVENRGDGEAGGEGAVVNMLEKNQTINRGLAEVRYILR